MESAHPHLQPQAPDRPDLAIKKELAQCAPHGGPCTFRIIVTNDSDVPYTGPILVGNTINAGRRSRA